MVLLPTGLQQTVLFLDHGPQIESLLRSGILNYPCQMSFCTGGKKEALQVIQLDPPDLLVASIDLHGGTASDLLHELNQKMASIPSIFIAEPGSIEVHKKVGAFDLIQRPFDTKDLIQKINRAVQATRQFRKKTRAESFIEYSKVHEESVTRGLTVSELLELKNPS